MKMDTFELELAQHQYPVYVWTTRRPDHSTTAYVISYGDKKDKSYCEWIVPGTMEGDCRNDYGSNK